MTHYFISFPNTQSQYVHFKVRFENLPAKAQINLPAWRPGRYELGNFAKNIKGFKVFDAKGKLIDFRKIDLHSWEINNSENEVIEIHYSYYASELNAGSTFLAHDQFYTNPVNCFVYAPTLITEKHSVQIECPENWKIACSMTQENGCLQAEDFHELADSPIICSPNLLYESYEVNETKFHLWFNGIKEVNWEKLKGDFEKFTQKQIEKFIEFPVKNYHWLFQIVPYKAYHGVEHQKSTVILLGPEYDLFKDVYPDLLGVSSHELYHTWNVKAIRPMEMYPYDYQKPNLSKLGYLCEGITTYQGDLMLLKSGVFNLNEYLKEMNAQLQKHFDNFGRFTYSVADSSFDTWLDGYTPGAPGRKVSIYTEGCLLAFVLDIKIRKFSNSKNGLDEFMRKLYYNFALENKGVSEEDFQHLAIEMAGEEMKEIFFDFHYGTRPYESILVECFEEIGLELIQKTAVLYTHGRLGFKTIPQGQNFIVKAIFPGSPAELGGLQMEDELIALNGKMLQGNIDDWCFYFDENIKEFTLNRSGNLMTLRLPEVQRNFYSTYSLKVMENLSAAQKKMFEQWKK